MAWIVPNSKIYFLKGIRLNENYTDTAYFDTEQDQNDYFMGKVAISLTQENYSYLRHTAGQIKVKLTMRQLQGCSYIMFKNIDGTSDIPKYEDKWYYAFVTNYEYINDETTLVYYEIDLLQTYMFDYTIKPCMVERNHTIDDTLGKNRVPEGLDTGEYVYDERNDNHLLWTDWSICIFHTLNNDGNAVSAIDGKMMGGLYSGLNIKVCSTVAQANAFLTNVSACALEGAVVAVVMLPTYYTAQNSDHEFIHDEYTYNDDNSKMTFSDDDTYRDSSEEGSDKYKPHNNKCYLAPFRGIYVTNGQGTVASYNIEDFTNWQHPKFTAKFSLGCVSDCMLQPVSYRFQARQFGVELSGFPQCAYTTDGFKSWMARNSGYLALAQTNLEQQNSFQNSALALQQQGLDVGIANTNALYGMNKDYMQQAYALDSNMASYDAGMNTIRAIGGGAAAVAGGYAVANMGGALVAGAGAAMNIDSTYRHGQYNLQSLENQYNNTMANAAQNNRYANQSYGVSTAQIANQKASINAANAIAVKQLAMQKHVASLTPPSFHGQSVGSATKLFGDFGYHIGIFKSRAQFVRKADDFFDLYGYAQNELLKPYRKARKHWTYVKTRGANFRDISNPLTNRGVPADDMEAINNLYDGGIRFWTNPDIIGDYTAKVPGTDITYQQDNTILNEPSH